jgi:cell division protein FtsL
MPQQHPNPHVRRVRDPRASRRQMFLLASCLVLAAGFIYAVRQQILAVEYGYKTESLRREREELLDEQRRLLLALQEGSSPAQLEQAARELGMQPAHAAQIESAAPRQEQEPAHGARIFVGTATAGTVMRR